MLYRGDEPLFYLGEFPVRLITLLVALRSAAVIIGALFIAAGHQSLLGFFAYDSTGVTHGQIWRLVSYIFVVTPDLYLWFLIDMVMLYYFGREVENGLGWQRFGILYLGLVLLGPLMLQAFGYAGIPQSFAGAGVVDFAVFAAFVVMHPGAQFFFGIAARWVFVALLAVYSLKLLAGHDMPDLLVFISSCLLAIFLMRRSGFNEPLFGWSIQWALPGFRRPNPRFSVVRGGLSAAKPGPVVSETKSVPPDAEQEMDRLLEKISSKGIGSLSTSERAALEKARQVILQRGGGGSSR